MPMPNSTTTRITWIELSALRSKILLAVAIRPVATWETRPTTRMGMIAMITLRKMMESSTTMSSTVAMPTISSACSDASWESRLCAAPPVTPYSRSEPSSAVVRSVRRSLTASIDWVSKPVASSARPTPAIWTSLFSDGGWAWAPMNAGARLPLRPPTTFSTSALSASVSGSPSARLNTMMAPTWLASGNASDCRFAALIDS